MDVHLKETESLAMKLEVKGEKYEVEDKVMGSILPLSCYNINFITTAIFSVFM
jgi:hypothetical protein